MKQIESVSNPQVKRWRSLTAKKARDLYGEYLIEGEKLVKEAVASGAPIKALLVTPESAGRYAALCAEYETYVLPRRVFDAVCDVKTPQGIAAVAAVEPELPPKDLPQNGLIVILDAVQDPGNVGTIIRSADAAGAEAVLLGMGCADAYAPKVVRAAMGSTFHLSIYGGIALPEALDALKERGFFLLAAHLKGEERLPHIPQRCAVLIGNESSGLGEESTGRCDALYRLPVYGRAESLNAAVAAGIVLYDVARALHAEK
ncbi:MAG: TrmH family RNA methyltransferase [Christensenellales bacterium]|jgi:TrmH family RNA methyltransferase